MHEPTTPTSPGTAGSCCTRWTTWRTASCRADAAGFALAVHAIGDRANQLVLDAFEKAVRANGGATAAVPHRARADRAPRRPRALPRARGHRLDPAVPRHRRHALRREAPRARRAAATPTTSDRSWTRASTWRSAPTGTWSRSTRGSASTPRSTRECPEGGPAGGFLPQEKRITLEQALDLYTRGSACAERAERDKGTLAPGKLADCVVFGADLFAVAPRELLRRPGRPDRGGRPGGVRAQSMTLRATGRPRPAARRAAGASRPPVRGPEAARPGAHPLEPGPRAPAGAAATTRRSSSWATRCSASWSRTCCTAGTPTGPRATRASAARPLVAAAEPGRARAERLGCPALLRLGRGEEKTGGRKKAAALGRRLRGGDRRALPRRRLRRRRSLRATTSSPRTSTSGLGGHDARARCRSGCRPAASPCRSTWWRGGGPEPPPALPRRSAWSRRPRVGAGEGSSKKAAQQEAARQALATWHRGG